MITRFQNGIMLTDRENDRRCLYIEDGRILALTEEKLDADRVVDLGGCYLSPGFIDIHTHGAGGRDFADGTVEDILVAAHAHAAYGTTTVYPTCTSSSFDDTIAFIRNVREAMTHNAPAHPFVAGSHLEGPYFSMAQKGAQNPQYVKDPDPREYRRFVEEGMGSVRRISFAPELPGALALCDYLAKEGIVAAFGHTDGVYSEIKPAIDRGCRLATHLYSGMNTVVRRNLMRALGAVETAYLEDSVTAEIICDGIHLPKELLSLIYKLKGAHRLCLITDSMRAAGMGEGPSLLGPKHDAMPCTVKNGVAYLTDMTGFAGSVATADRLLRVMHKEVGVSLTECIRMISTTPAEVMGLTDRGALAPGLRADLVILDSDLLVKSVYIEGRALEGI